jgi:phosphoribosylanthranilate isomerase
VRIKVCGITSPEDAEGCVALGVTLLGLNFVPSSPRCIDLATAGRIHDAVRGRAELWGVVADRDEAALVALRRDARLDRLQLHGSEPPELVRALAPYAFKALRVGAAADVAAAGGYDGLLLVDAKVPGALGGTGRTVDFALVAPLARTRPILLAGGLTPGNVAAAVRAVEPWGVDVASGVERSPGLKDLDAVQAFVAGARLACAGGRGRGPLAPPS